MVTSLLEKEIKIEGAGRKQWPNKLQFLCANISYAVGLGMFHTVCVKVSTYMVQILYRTYNTYNLYGFKVKIRNFSRV